MRATRATVAAVAAASFVIVPLQSSAQATAGPTLTIDVTAARHAISPNIYGVNFADRSTSASEGLTVDRVGGNSVSLYNYLTNVYNTGSDYYFENIATGLGAKNQTAAAYVKSDRKAKLRTVFELPMTGYVAKASPTTHPFLCSFPKTAFGNQNSFDPYDPNCGNGVSGSTNLTANPTTAATAVGPSFDQAEVAYFVKLFGTAAKGGVPFYELDNEPTLWNSTHRDVHPVATTFSEIATRSTATAAAVKKADPTAAVLGPSDWGWCAYFYSAADGCNNGPDKASHGNAAFAPWYLAQMKAYQTAHGVRLLDYFDEHYYPQESGMALGKAGSAVLQADRLASTRTLWDPTYTDKSWIGTDVGQRVYLISRMRAWVKASYPGTKLSISEYNFGGLESLNGALTEADVLGIFGREQVSLATLWSPPTSSQPGAFAFRLFRNYDGHGATFGNTYVRSTSANQGKLSVYAAQRSADGAVTVVVINKSTTKLTSKLALKDFAAGGTAQVWRYSGANLKKIVRQANVKASSSMSLTFPASSATVIVIPKA
ncbi:glycoside hydrolase family 44 protein [Acidothermaceae bacterium B102]|nr:glycoside hydrolase family 44 protein [Acidothermaceae bacterium B102]